MIKLADTFETAVGRESSKTVSLAANQARSLRLDAQARPAERAQGPHHDGRRRVRGSVHGMCSRLPPPPKKWRHP